MADPQDLPEILAERRQRSERVLDTWGGIREAYSDWDRRKRVFDAIYSDRWEVVFPDNSRTQGLAKIPNVVKITIEGRARRVAATRYSISIRSETGPKGKSAAEKRERILWGYHYKNDVPGMIQQWGFDAMGTGLCATKVLPDMTKTAKSDIFPVYTRIDPRTCYPAPAFAQGPGLDDCVVAYEDRIDSVGHRFGQMKELASLVTSSKNIQASQERVRVIEFYDAQRALVIAQVVSNLKTNTRHPFMVLADAQHRLGMCPIAIGARPTADAVYRGEFDSDPAVLNTWNRLVSLTLDSAADFVYPVRKVYDVANPDDYGPDARIDLNTAQSIFEYVLPGQRPFENEQLISRLEDYANRGALASPQQAGANLPSIVSAAGIAATGSAGDDAVRSVQRDVIAPMLQRANELAFACDEKWGDAQKTISGYAKGSAFSEEYRPSKDIDGDCRNEVTYGFGAGYDEVNANVMVLQQYAGGNGLISRQTAQELSPLVQSPQYESKQLAEETLEKAVLAGLIAQAARPPEQGGLTAAQLAKIKQAFSKDTPLEDAIIEIVGELAPAPLAAPTPPGAGLPGPSGTGNAGAAQPQGQTPSPAFNGPPIQDLLAGPVGQGQ